MDRDIRYCMTRDGVRIGYCVEGEGPALLIVPFFIQSFFFDSSIPESGEFNRAVGRGRTLITYDARGTGISERMPEDMSHEALVLDIEAVVRAAQVPSVSVLGGSIAGPRAIRFCVDRPDLVDALILYGTTSRARDVMSAESVQALAMLARSNWMLASRTLADMAGREQAPDTVDRYAEWYAMSADGEAVARTLETANGEDVSGLLRQVTCPTLILHRPKDSVFPFSAGEAIAAGIPGATLISLPGAGHNVSLGEAQAVARAIDSFLRQRLPEASNGATPAAHCAVPAVRTVLFTDLVGHTEMMQRLGDEKGREVLREHERVTRQVLRQHCGVEVKTMGDGFLASFSSVTNAVQCAIALQRAFDQRNGSAAEPLKIRVGLNAGEPIEEEGDLFGTTVILAARIAATAESGEILASLAVRELCAGKKFLFSDRGETALRGFEDPVRLYEVRWWAEEGLR